MTDTLSSPLAQDARACSLSSGVTLSASSRREAEAAARPAGSRPENRETANITTARCLSGVREFSLFIVFYLCEFFALTTEGLTSQRKGRSNRLRMKRPAVGQTACVSSGTPTALSPAELRLVSACRLPLSQRVGSYR